MNDRRIESEQRLSESLYDLYEQGGLELYLAGMLGLSDQQVKRLKLSNADD